MINSSKILTSIKNLFIALNVSPSSNSFRKISILIHRVGGTVGKSVRPASGRLGVRIPAATDLSRKDR